MVKKLYQLNKALPALWLSILIYGVICQIIGLLFLEEKIKYSIGLWVGIILALLMAFHMAYVLMKALDLGEHGAQTSVMKHNMIRYASVVIILGLLMMTDVANPLAAFVGIMGLKIGAYVQPLISKLLDKK